MPTLVDFLVFSQISFHFKYRVLYILTCYLKSCLGRSVDVITDYQIVGLQCLFSSSNCVNWRCQYFAPPISSSKIVEGIIVQFRFNI
jgi:hypothetical protein